MAPTISPNTAHIASVSANAAGIGMPVRCIKSANVYAPRPKNMPVAERHHAAIADQKVE